MSVGVGRPNAPLILRGGGPLRGEGKTGKPSNRERCLGNHPLGNPWDGPGPQRLPFSRPTALELCVLARFWRASARSTGRRRASCLVPCSVIVFWRFSVLARFRHRSSSTHYRVGLWAPPPHLPPSLSPHSRPSTCGVVNHVDQPSRAGALTYRMGNFLAKAGLGCRRASSCTGDQRSATRARSLARAHSPSSLSHLSPRKGLRIHKPITHPPSPYFGAISVQLVVEWVSQQFHSVQNLPDTVWPLGRSAPAACAMCAMCDALANQEPGSWQKRQVFVAWRCRGRG